MSFSFSSLIRLLVLLAVGTTMLAVGLSRLDPPRPEWRSRHRAKHTNINEYFLDVTDRIPRWLDTDTGQIEAYATEDGDVLEAASYSPWVDEKGHGQVVGRWSSRTKDGPMSMSKDFGLARYSFPAGEMLDQVSTEIVPVGPPCWFPGTRARVLFVAGDGMLYSYAFEPEPFMKAADREGKRDPAPKPLTWRCPMPGSGKVFIGDLTWPEDPRMSGCILVSLRQQASTEDGMKCFTRTEIWWLKLNIAGTEIVEAGRMLEQDVKEYPGQSSDLRAPTVGTLADGKLVLAYLSQNTGEPGWMLRITPIDFEGDHLVPQSHEARSLVLSSRCQPVHPSFSTDGRWLNAITGPDMKSGRATRISTTSLFKL